MTDVVARLRAAGCVAAEQEAEELSSVARDEVELDDFVARREAGEPLAWITGRVRFCGIELVVRPGVYVPRWQTESLAESAARLLPPSGVAVELCCGSAAVARVLSERHPGARVLATDVDPGAIACAAANGVDAFVGDLYDPLPADLRGAVDVIVAVPPYVPSDALSLLARSPEPLRALDGGRGGLDVVRRIVSEASEWLRAGGALCVEIGRPQVRAVNGAMTANAFDDVAVIHDPDGDVCGMSARFQPRA